MGAAGSHRKRVGPAASSGRGSAHRWGLYPLEIVSSILRATLCELSKGNYSLFQAGDKYLPWESQIVKYLAAEKKINYNKNINSY